MKRLIALLALLGALTSCAAPPAQAGPEENTEVPMTDLAPADKPANGALKEQAVFSQAAPRQLCYTVALETLEDSAQAADGTVLARRSYALPVMTVELADGTALTEAAAPAEEAALTAAETFNSQFRDWAAADGFDEVTAWAEEDRAGRAETGAAWTPYVLELESEVCRTGDLISVQAVYYGSSGGAHPNTVLMAWNFDLSTGRFLTPEQLAADGQAFSEAVAQELLRQSRETAAAYDMAPEDFFWTNYQEILAGWSSYAVSFDGEGMTVGFSPYELAAYAAGPQIYHLPYEQLAGYFSTHGLALLGLAATEK